MSDFKDVSLDPTTTTDAVLLSNLLELYIQFADKQMMWGCEPTLSAIFAKDYFVRMGVRDVLIPGVGYGRNAKLGAIMWDRNAAFFQDRSHL